MGTVTFKLEADEAKAVAAFLKIVDSQKKVEDGQRKISQAGKESESALAGLGHTAGATLSSMVTGFLGVSAVMATMRQIAQAVHEEIRRTGETAKTTQESLMRALAAGMDFANMPRLKAAVTGPEFQGPASIGERIAAFQAVSGAYPTAPFEQKLGLAAEAARGKVTGLDIGRYGTLIGELAKVYPEKAPEKLADIATLISATEGRYGRRLVSTRGGAGIGALEKWSAMGLGTREQGIGLLLASLESAQGAEGLTKMLDVLGEEKTVPWHPGVAMTPHEQATRRFYGAGPADRWAMLKADPGMRKEVMGSHAASVEAMMIRGPARFEAAVTSAQTNMLSVTSQAAAYQNQDWARELDVQTEEANAEISELERGEGGRMRAIRAKDASIRQRFGPTKRALIKTAENILTYGTLGLVHGEEVGAVPEGAPTPADARAGEIIQEAVRAGTVQGLDEVRSAIAPNPNVHVEPSGGGT